MTTCQHKINAALFLFDGPLPGIFYRVYFTQQEGFWQVEIIKFDHYVSVPPMSDFLTGNEPDLTTARIFLTMHLEQQQSPDDGA